MCVPFGVGCVWGVSEIEVERTSVGNVWRLAYYHRTVKCVPGYNIRVTKVHTAVHVECNQYVYTKRHTHLGGKCLKR